jgi:hypothetical protein
LNCADYFPARDAPIVTADCKAGFYIGQAEHICVACGNGE